MSYWLTVFLARILNAIIGSKIHAVIKNPRIVNALAFLDSTRNIGIPSPNFMNLVPSGFPNLTQFSNASGSVSVVYADWTCLKIASAPSSLFLSG